jgi:phosphoglycerate dehydrogenase-like enzyme
MSSSSPRTGRIAVLNGTCLDVSEANRAAIQARGIELLAEQRYRTMSVDQTLEIIRTCDAIVVPANADSFLPYDRHLREMPRLRCVAIAASGYDDYDVESATRNGVVVTNAPVREGAEVVADMAVGLMLAVCRQIPYHHLLLSRGDRTRGTGTSMFGRTLGIIGLGNIGRHVALRVKGFHMRVLASEPAPDRAFVAEHGVELVSQDELLREADFVSLHVRLNEQTRRMIGRKELALMKPTAVLINTARQDLVDEEAVVEAILQKRIGGAGLDDPPGAAAQKLFGRPNVVFTPHLGNRSIEGMHAVFMSAIDSAVAVLRGERPPFVVNPQVYERGVRGAAR